MAIGISTSAQNTALSGIVGLLGGGVLRIYSGTRPANPDTAPSGTLLAEFQLNDPAAGAPSGGVASLDVTGMTTSGVGNGQASWFRMLGPAQAAGNGLGVIDGDVSVTGGGGDLTLNTTTISIGLTLHITGGSITMPASG